jgi:hypothetical protein
MHSLLRQLLMWLQSYQQRRTRSMETCCSSCWLVQVPAAVEVQALGSRRRKQQQQQVCRQMQQAVLAAATLMKRSQPSQMQLNITVLPKQQQQQ